ncbi:MAG: YidC/Oxa1 family membrane protein insertase [Candidatus Uhrbacteria bacterium]|nr:YidC/Oxa1 family membrane protein insertase [Candidatus Uhrbacteria bacterium]
MSGIIHLFNVIFLQPILNILIWLYDVLPGNDIGLAIIILTIFIKLILYPFTVAQIKQQRALQELQPKIDEIRNRLKDKKDEQGRELMALYAREKVNPASSCLPLLIQLPVFLALYQALVAGLSAQNFSLLYSFVPNPQSVDTVFLGFLDLSKPSYVLAVIAALVQYVQTKQILKPPAATIASPPPEVVKSAGAKDESMATMMNKQMMYVMPVMTAVIGFTLPGGLTLYWFVMSLLTLLQQWWLLKKMPPKILPQLTSGQ